MRRRQVAEFAYYASFRQPVQLLFFCDVQFNLPAHRRKTGALLVNSALYHQCTTGAERHEFSPVK